MSRFIMHPDKLVFRQQRIHRVAAVLVLSIFRLLDLASAPRKIVGFFPSVVLLSCFLGLCCTFTRPLSSVTHGPGMSINIVEVTWKGNLKRAFPDPNAYSAFMGNFSTATGSVTLVMMILGRFIFQKFGWTTAALVTPTVLALTGAFFFSLILFEGTFAPLLSFFGTTPLMAAVLIGAVQARRRIVYYSKYCCSVL